MAERHTDLSKELNGYAYGEVAARFLQQENFHGAKAALENLVSEMGFGKKIEGLLKGATTNEESIAVASSTYAKSYRDARESAGVEELWAHYDSEGLVDKYLPKDLKNKAKEELRKFRGFNYGDIARRVRKAREIDKSTTGNFNEEQKNKAKEEIEKYKKISALFETLDDAYLSKYVNIVNEGLIKKKMEKIFEEKDRKNE